MTFRDPAVEDRFRTEGSVVIDLLDGDEVAELRRDFDQLDHDLHGDSPFASGFHTTMYDGRAEYRRAVLEAIERSMAAGLERHLVDHHVLFANFAAKLPGGDAVPHHLDWTFVDEDEFTSATVWCPLGSTDVGNGTLGVVVRSHGSVDFIRPVNRRDYALHAAVSSGQDQLLPLGPGQALVMDNRMVHFSSPNRSDETRVAAACVVAPRRAPIRHYWVDEDEQLVRLHLDREFFLSYEIGAGPRHAAGVRGSTIVTDVRYG